MKMRSDCLSGSSYDTGWAEWSIPAQTDDVYNKDLWYETNPSMGAHLDERKIRAEIRKDIVDFNIQRLGVWLKYNQKSEVSEAEWNALKVAKLPELKGRLFAGIKFGADGQNVAMSIAVKTADGRIFVESIDCQSIRKGDGWILRFLKDADIQMCIVDGKSGQELLIGDCKEAKIKPLPQSAKVAEICTASTMFTQALEQQSICHAGQPSLQQSVCNCDRRAIGSAGGYGFKSLKEGVDIALMESMVLAHWECATSKERRKQRIRM